MFKDVNGREIACDADEIHLSAYNAAFYELGLKWHWDAQTYAALHGCGDHQSRLRKYIESRHPHLLNAYDIDFLAAAIESAKARCYDSLLACSSRIAPVVDWAAMQAAEVGF
jgi:predicted heme/steroid binding protein